MRACRPRSRVSGTGAERGVEARDVQADLAPIRRAACTPHRSPIAPMLLYAGSIGGGVRAQTSVRYAVQRCVRYCECVCGMRCKVRAERSFERSVPSVKAERSMPTLGSTAQPRTTRARLDAAACSMAWHALHGIISRAMLSVVVSPGVLATVSNAQIG